MSENARYLFDENFGKPAVENLKGLLGYSGEEFEIAHVLDYQEQGVLDDVWIPKLASQGWIVITSDAGKRPSRGSKLPILCSEYNVTHVTLSGALHNKNTFKKIQAIVSVWDELLELPNAPPGSRHKLQLTASGGFKLVSPPVKAESTDDKKQQEIEFQEEKSDE